MANHLRRQIREAAATLLTGLATTGSNVFQNRVYPLQDGDLPALRIFTQAESVEANTIGADPARLQERTLSLVVEGCVKDPDGFDDTADAICKEVEVAIAGNNTLGGLCKWVQLTSTEIEMDGETAQPIAIVRLTFQVFYITALNAPDVAL